MKHLLTYSFVVAILFTINAASPVWADQNKETTVPHQEQQEMMPAESAQPEADEDQKPATWQPMMPMMNQPGTPTQGYPMMGNTHMMPMMSGGNSMHHMMHGGNQWQAGNNQSMQVCPMMSHMSMMHEGHMMGMMPMMPGGSPMHSMMHGGHQGMHGGYGLEEEDPQKAGLMLQMHGDMMKAMGEILIKYGKLLAETAPEQE